MRIEKQTNKNTHVHSKAVHFGVTSECNMRVFKLWEEVIEPEEKPTWPQEEHASSPQKGSSCERPALPTTPLHWSYSFSHNSTNVPTLTMPNREPLWEIFYSFLRHSSANCLYIFYEGQMRTADRSV